MGDFNGIGPEVTLKALSSPAIRRICLPVLIGSTDVYEYYAKILRLKATIREIDDIPSRMRHDVFYLHSMRRFQKPVISPGRVSKEAGCYAGEAIETAFGLCRRGAAGGMVTAPVSKKALNEAGYGFPGQTEMLAKLSGQRNFAMMLVSGSLRVGLATIHLPLRKVPREISEESVAVKLSVIHKSLQRDFKIASPRIAVLGLNPHSGESGGIGDEEIRILNPAVKKARRKGMDVHGPFPADGFFGMRKYGGFDAVLCMYHDQGLIPLKLLGFNTGVNYTAGLPVVRTSPDHGTAFEIAGRGAADPSSMIEAVKLSVNIVRSRAGIAE